MPSISGAIAADGRPALSLSLPLGRPPTLVHLFGAFGELTHGRNGDEPYRNGFWVLNIATDGEGELELAGRRHPFHHGCAVLVPPDVAHVYRFRRPTFKSHAHFRAPPSAGRVPVAVVTDLGPRLDWFLATIRDCRDRASAEPERAVAALWHLLWQLAGGPIDGDGPVHHPAIRALLTHLADHLDDPLEPEALARRLGVSATHLNRLCRAAFGLPLAAHVRRIRLERAEHLLRQTDRKISDIAAEVGIPDLQHFNKLMRRHAGRAPRGLRRG